MKTLDYISLILLVTLISCNKKYTLDGSIDNPGFIGEWVLPRSTANIIYVITEKGKLVHMTSRYDEHPSEPGAESKKKGRIQIEGHRMFMEYRYLLQENSLVELQIIQEPTNVDTTFTLGNKGERSFVLHLWNFIS